MIKLKNIYLGLKDQMPFGRFIRNLRKGHVLGLFHKRSHFRNDGKPKQSFPSKESAKKAAASMMKKHGNYFSNYKCIFCDRWHLGKNRENKTSDIPPRIIVDLGYHAFILELDIQYFNNGRILCSYYQLDEKGKQIHLFNYSSGINLEIVKKEAYDKTIIGVRKLQENVKKNTKT